ncbi:PASTA domain-containing protein [Gordonia jinghuaiqii]|uniref:PASTA domain-containing protein n=2 Tax=Gordonia jinghuaiqii TaxID=2758710 RepID=A0A7D7QQ70_9ACTN|nr:PASTA domain-containing protein [Gordonia jinghuaiqii]QMT01926.1 PASTA domain-containing protein [Gordonia jinghuaiqii]
MGTGPSSSVSGSTSLVRYSRLGSSERTINRDPLSASASGPYRRFRSVHVTTEEASRECVYGDCWPSTSTPAPPPRPATTTTRQVSIMPDVVCMNLQAAQNAIQAAGVFFSRSTDASGEGRSQLVDSNWVVVAQTPGPSTPFDEGEAVLSAVKIGEPSPC